VERTKFFGKRTRAITIGQKSSGWPEISGRPCWHRARIAITAVTVDGWEREGGQVASLLQQSRLGGAFSLVHSRHDYRDCYACIVARGDGARQYDQLLGFDCPANSLGRIYPTASPAAQPAELLNARIAIIRRRYKPGTFMMF
jgi:hypothetical protein